MWGCAGTKSGYWQWLLPVLCVYSSTSKDCFLLDFQSYADFNLTAAVASAFPLCLSLFPNPAHSYLLNSATVSETVTVYAEASEIDLAGLVTIGLKGNLTLYNASLEAGAGQLEVRGSLELRSCSVKRWKAAFVQVRSGFVTVHGSYFEGNSQLFDFQSAISAFFDTSVFSNNSELAISVQACDYVQLSHCSFQRNSSPVLLHFSLLPGQLALIAACEFRSNSGNLVYIRRGNINFLESVGTGNTGSGLHIAAESTNVTIRDVQWSGNSAPFLLISRLEGTVSVGNSSFTHQSDIGAVQIANSGDFALCQVDLWGLSFADSGILPVLPTASVLYSISCSVSLAHSFVQNCTVLSTVAGLAYGAIVQAMGVLVLREVVLQASGSSGAGIFLLLATGELEAVRLLQTVVGGGALLSMQSATVGLRKVEVVGVQHSRIRSYTDSAMLALFATSTSLVCQNVTLSDFSQYRGGGWLLMTSLMTCNSLVMRNMSVYTAIAEFGSQSTVNSMVLEQCQLVILAEIVGGSTLIGQGIALTDVNLSEGLIRSSNGGTVRLSNVTIDRSWAGCLVFAYKTKVFLESLSVANSEVGQLLSNTLDCELEVRGLEYRNTTGGLATARNSLITIAEASFDRLSWDSVLMLYACNVSLSAVRIASIRSNSKAITAAYSHISFHQVTITSIDNPHDSFITLTASSLLLNSTSIEHFNTQLINAQQCNITILTSSLVDGKAARLENGGVVNCVDCWEVRVRDSVFEAVQAEQGGAVYVEGVEVEGRLDIVNSVFRTCTARRGGAGLVNNVALQVVNSHFEDCEAVLSGGALDIRTKEDQSRLIAFSSFTHNAAYEGGALKWHSAPITLQNCTFELNTATYGPNFASYGASLLLVTATSYPPGQPLHLAYELLDHYGQRLLLANSQAISLAVDTNASLKGVTNRVTDGGVANFTDLEIHAEPGQTLTIQAMCRGKYEDSEMTTELETVLHMRECQIGEIRTNSSCELCAEGYFSLSPDDSSCRLCPNIALCPGGSRVLPKSGAWRSAQSSEPVLPCPIPATCEGGELNACASRYTGKLCAECAEGNFALTPVACWPCPHVALIVTETLVVGLLYLLWLQLVLICPDSKLHLLRVFIQHIQVLAALAYTRLDLPTDLQVFLRGTLDLATLSAATFPQQCITKGSYLPLGVALGALGLAVLLGILLLACRNCYYREELRRSKEKGRLCVSFCWYLPFAAALTLLPVFSCQPMSKDGEWLVSNMQQPCWNTSNFDTKFYLSLFSLLFVTAIPMTAGIVLHKVGKVQGSCEASSQLLQLLAVGALILQMGLSPSSQLVLPLCFLYLLLAFSALTVSFCMIASAVSYFLLTLSFSLQFATTQTHSRSGHQVYSSVIISTNSLFLLLLLIAVFKSQSSITYQASSVPLDVSSASPTLFVPNQSLADPDMVNLGISAA